MKNIYIFFIVVSSLLSFDVFASSRDFLKNRYPVLLEQVNSFCVGHENEYIHEQLNSLKQVSEIKNNGKYFEELRQKLDLTQEFPRDPRETNSTCHIARLNLAIEGIKGYLSDSDLVLSNYDLGRAYLNLGTYQAKKFVLLDENKRGSEYQEALKSFQKYIVLDGKYDAPGKSKTSYAFLAHYLTEVSAYATKSADKKLFLPMALEFAQKNFDQPVHSDYLDHKQILLDVLIEFIRAEASDSLRRSDYKNRALLLIEREKLSTLNKVVVLQESGDLIEAQAALQSHIRGTSNDDLTGFCFANALRPHKLSILKNFNPHWFDENVTNFCKKLNVS